jgi:hypothetical protein
VAAFRFGSPTWPSTTKAQLKSRAYFLPDCRYFDERSSGVTVSERRLVCTGVKNGVFNSSDRFDKELSAGVLLDSNPDAILGWIVVL